MKTLSLVVFSKKSDHEMTKQSSILCKVHPHGSVSQGHHPLPMFTPKKAKGQTMRGSHTVLFFFFLLLLFFVFVFVCRCWETLLLSYCPIYFKTTFEGCWAIWGVGRGETFHQQLIDYYPNWLCAFLFKQHYFLFCFVFNWAVEGPQQSSKNLSRELEIQGLGIPAPVLSAV